MRRRPEEKVSRGGPGAAAGGGGESPVLVTPPARVHTHLVVSDRSPFLGGALAWVYGSDPPVRCPSCGFDWSTTSAASLHLIGGVPDALAELLETGDGMAPPPDGTWNATSYVWHLSDLARSWSERWIQLADSPGARLAGWDPDELARARNYGELPSVAALWSLRTATATLLELTAVMDPTTSFEHGDWGTGTVADGTRWLAHEYVHHRRDVEMRVVQESRLDP